MGGHRPGAQRRARRPQASARPRWALVREGAALCQLCRPSLHRSPLQHRVVSWPLLTWPCWPFVGVHHSEQFFSTRFPDRGSTLITVLQKLELAKQTCGFLQLLELLHTWQRSAWAGERARASAGPREPAQRG